MVLASQMARDSSRRASGPRENKRKAWPWVTTGLVLVAAAVGYVWYQTAMSGSSLPATAKAASGFDPSAVHPQAKADPTPVLRFGVNTPSVATPPAPAAQPVVSPPPAPSSPPVAAPGAPVLPTASPALTIATAPGSPLEQGMKLVEQGKLLDGRRALSDLLYGGSIAPADAQAIRDTLASVNRKLIFSPEVIPGDTVSEYYVIQPGDRLTKIAWQHKVTHQFLELINNVNPNRINAGQRIKLVNGPFHVVVNKSDYRLDVFVNDNAGKKTYVRSFRVGLGEADSTPVGSWIIRPGGKATDSGWTNPRTGETFAPRDPKNPIGKYWLALQGTDEKTKSLRGYGIHGTIDPASIGHQASMGCVRMGDADIELVYRMLVDGQSTVLIQP
ncbi:MAG: L,D-transpeptidase family protein [Planctomycetes bacterium]|nr:L,D-transpeptidase family protein [Planctomycetota bacterium]